MLILLLYIIRIGTYKVTPDCRVEFGEMKTLVKTNTGHVYHMELDLRDTNTILYSDYLFTEDVSRH